MRSFIGLFFSVAFVLSNMAIAQAQDLGCSSHVSLNGGTIEVEADASGDDTENIQCALDAATDGGYRDVLLTSPEYSIGAIAATGFVGDLRHPRPLHLHPLLLLRAEASQEVPIRWTANDRKWCHGR